LDHSINPSNLSAEVWSDRVSFQFMIVIGEVLFAVDVVCFVAGTENGKMQRVDKIFRGLLPEAREKKVILAGREIRNGWGI